MDMECGEIRNEFSALLDGELSETSHAAVMAHLSLCSDCLRELEGLKRVDLAYRGLGPVTVPDDFEDGVKEAIQPGATSNSERRAARPVWWPMAAAAALLIAASSFVAYIVLHTEPRVEMASRAGAVQETVSAPIPPAIEALGAAVKQEKAEALSKEMALRDPLAEEITAAEQGAVDATDAASPVAAAAPQDTAFRASQPQAAAAGQVKKFEMRDGAWVELGYADEATAPLARDSETVIALAERFPELKAVLARETWRVIVKADGVWYEIEAVPRNTPPR